MFDKKTIVIVTGIVFVSLYFFNKSEVTRPLAVKDNAVQIKHEEAVVKSYTDVFKEAKDIGFVEKLQNEEEIKNIQRESQIIIANVENMIGMEW
jgi:hypothetical protein